MILSKVMGFVLILMGIGQIYLTRRYLKHMQLEGDKNTSPFAPAALYFGYLFGTLFIIIGSQIMLHM